MKLFNLKNSAYEYYRKNIRGNETITYEQAQKKLTRNVLLSVKRNSLSNMLKLQQEYVYGYMRIIVRFGVIVEIENKIKDTVVGWSKDREKYIRISKELGINEY